MLLTVLKVSAFFGTAGPTFLSSLSANVNMGGTFLSGNMLPTVQRLSSSSERIREWNMISIICLQYDKAYSLTNVSIGNPVLASTSFSDAGVLRDEASWV